MNMPYLVTLLLIAASSLPAADMIGYRGDTTGVFDVGTVPAKGRILWRAPLPNWSFGFPIVVGGKVFVTSEPGWKATFPELLCFDAKDGKELWRLELDHLPYTDLPKAKQEELRTEMDRRWKWWRDTWTNSGGKSLHSSKTKPPWSQRGAPHPKLNKLMRVHGLYAGTWWDWGMMLIGHTFPTPVSDGEALYVVTSRGSHMRVSFDGKIEWLQRMTAKQFYGMDEKNARSPVLYKDLLICANGRSVRAYDTRTGKELWRVPTGAEFTVATPVFIELDGTDYLYTCVNTLIRLPDGHKVALTGGIGEGIHTPTVADEHDIIFFTGNGEHCSFTHSHKGKGLGMPTAVKFIASGDAVEATILWQGSKKKGEKESKPPLYHAGKLYCGNTIFDALTGKILAKGDNRRGLRVVPKTKHVLLTDGAHVFGLSAPKRGRNNKGEALNGVLQACTLDGKFAGSVTLPYTVDPERCKAKMGGGDWGFSGSCAFTLADGRVFVRGFDELYCIGR